MLGVQIQLLFRADVRVLGAQAAAGFRLHAQTARPQFGKTGRLLRKLAQARGLIVLTDSDGAGFQIRSYIKGCVDPRLIKHAYIPDVYGKERRKRTPSKEGKLGVEGMEPQVLLDALLRAGANVEDSTVPAPAGITKADLYARGLSGREGSAQKRRELLKSMELPERLSADSLLDVLNATMSKEEFYRLEL